MGETVWVSMMAAMMLPGAVPVVAKRVRGGGRAAEVPPFVVSYLAVWILVGLALSAADRPHGSFVAGAIAIATGVYELTPLKRQFRRRCRESVRSGFEFGRNCVDSNIGLVLILVAAGVMSVAWMTAVAVLALAQKLLPANAAVDVPVALAIVAVGALTLIAP